MYGPHFIDIEATAWPVRDLVVNLQRMLGSMAVRGSNPYQRCGYRGIQLDVRSQNACFCLGLHPGKLKRIRNWSNHVIGRWVDRSRRQWVSRWLSSIRYILRSTLLLAFQNAFCLALCPSVICLHHLPNLNTLFLEPDSHRKTFYITLNTLNQTPYIYLQFGMTLNCKWSHPPCSETFETAEVSPKQMPSRDQE